MANKVQHKRLWQTLPRWVVGVASALLGVTVFLVGIYATFALTYRGQIFPNTYIAGLNVGGLDKPTAEARILDQIRTFESSRLLFSVAGTPVQLSPDTISATYDAAASAQAAIEVGRSNGFIADVLAQVQTAIGRTDVPLAMDYNQAALDAYLASLGQRFNDEAQNAGIEYVREKVVVTDERPGEEFDKVALRTLIASSLERAHPLDGTQDFPLLPAVPAIVRAQVIELLPTIQAMVGAQLDLTFEEKSFHVTREQLTEWLLIESLPAGGGAGVEGFLESGDRVRVGVASEKVAAYAKTLADELAQDPIDAKLTIKGGKATVFQASQDGRALDEPATVTLITQVFLDRKSAPSAQAAVNAAIELPVSVTKPTVTSSTVEDLGIQELIGTGTTDFSGSPNNRVHNIGTGTRYLNGWLIKPGDEFSTVKALGAVDASTGYLPELVIKENKTIPEFGGGLCQVSTTLFRSVMNAGLPITERRNHSYRVSYYERGIGPGLDATVYLPRPDFRFKNDTPGWILVQGTIKGNSLTFELYGTPDGRISTIDGPHTLETTPAPATIYETTDQLAPGEQKEVEHAHAGAKTSATYTVTRNGEVINSQTFMSAYKALPARILEGPKPDSAPAPSTDQPSEGTGDTDTPVE